jgi:hypothetical protein
MMKRNNYYKELTADYSKPQLVAKEVRQKMIELSEKYNALQEPTLPLIDFNYDKAQIEKENKEWWPTHCEALRQGRGDLLAGEYRDKTVYFCQDGPFYGKTAVKQREKHWWALITQPGVTMVWPIVMFDGDVVYQG